MYVYFIKCESSPEIMKIGKANHVLRRLNDLQVCNPFKLSLIGCLKCKSEQQAFQIEMQLHGIFEGVHVRGEWFSYSRQIELAVKKILNAWPCSLTHLLGGFSWDSKPKPEDFRNPEQILIEREEMAPQGIDMSH